MANLETLRQAQRVFSGTFTGITSDQLLNIFRSNGSDNQGWCDIGDVDWERIVVEVDVTSYSGTSVTFKLKTRNNKGGTAVAATTLDAKNGAGTAKTSGSITATGAVLFAVSRQDADNDAGIIGKFIGVYADVTSIAKLAGTITIYAGK